MKIKGIDTKADLSKAEEIKILETLRDSFENTGNYLSCLFTREAVDYMSRKIQDDIMPDLFSELVNSGNEAMTAKSDLNIDVRIIKNLNRELKEVREYQTKCNKIIAQQAETIGIQKTEIERLQTKLARAEAEAFFAGA